jgi:G protein beta subunit-like protein
MIQDRDVTNIVPIATFQAHKDYLTRVLLSPDVKHLATCSADHTAKVWSLDPEYGPAKAAAEAKAKADEEADKGKGKGKASVAAVTETPSSGNGSPQSAPHNATPSDFSQVGSIKMASSQVWTLGQANDPKGADLFKEPSKQMSDTNLTKQSDSMPQFPEPPDGPPMDPTTNAVVSRDHVGNSPTLGLGLCIFGRLSISCNRLQRPLCASLGALFRSDHSPVQRTSPWRGLRRVERLF